MNVQCFNVNFHIFNKLRKVRNGILIVFGVKEGFSSHETLTVKVVAVRLLVKVVKNIWLVAPYAFGS